MRAVGQLHRLGAVPGELQERAAPARAAGRRPCRRRRGRRCGPRAPLTVRWASCWAAVQYIEANGGVADPGAVPLDRQPEVEAGTGRPQVVERRRVLRCRLRHAWPAPSSGTTHGDTEVANDLARNGPSGLIFPGLDVPGRPVVDQHHAEDVLGEVAGADPPARHAHHEPDLGLDVEPRGRAEHALAELPGRPLDRACRRPRPCPTGRGSRSAGAASCGGRPGGSGRRIRADVRGVVLGGVEVGVVGDLERQVQARPRRAGSRGGVRRQLGDPARGSRSTAAGRAPCSRFSVGCRQRAAESARGRAPSDPRRTPIAPLARRAC